MAEITFVKCLMEDSSIELINFSHVKRISEKSGDATKTDLQFIDGTTATIDCELSILIPYVTPILIKEDLAGNAL